LNTAHVRRNLSKSDKAGEVHEVQAVLEFTIAPSATSAERIQDQLNEAVREASNVDNMIPAPGGFYDVTPAMNAIDRISPSLASLVDKISQFIDIVDGISEVWFKIGGLPGHLIPMRWLF
jgi:hypothetical protein